MSGSIEEENRMCILISLNLLHCGPKIIVNKAENQVVEVETYCSMA